MFIAPEAILRYTVDMVTFTLVLGLLCVAVCVRLSKVTYKE